MISRFWYVLLFLSTQISLSAQEIQALTEWRSYLPYRSGRNIAQSPTNIIYATPWSIVLIDKNDLSHRFLSKVDGLSEVGIQTIAYDDSQSQLIVAYTNSAIDVIADGNITTISTINTNTNISGDKRINSIYTDDSRFIYLATGFGLVQLDAATLEFGSTLFTPFVIYDVVTWNGKIYAGTEDGLYTTSTDPNNNIADINNWNLLGPESGLPAVYSCNDIEIFEDRIYANIDEESIFEKRVDEDFTLFYQQEFDDFKIEYLTAATTLIVGLKDEQFSSKALFFTADGSYTLNLRLCTDRTIDALEDEQGRIWYADEWDEFRYSESIDDDCRRLTFNSPFSERISDLAVKDNALLVASGGASENYLYQSNRDGFFILDNLGWTNINQSSLSTIRDNDLLNFYSIAGHPSDSSIYVGTYWGGLLYYNLSDGTTQVFDQSNSSLQGVIGDESRERVTDMIFDTEENLWVSNFGAPKPLSVLTANNTWHSYEVGSDQNLTDIAIDYADQKWIAVFGNRGGVLVYDHNGTIEDPTDDRDYFLNTANSELTTTQVNTVISDLDGNIWVGTAEGPVIFECGEELYTGECPGRRIKVLQDSIPAFLLADEEIRTMAVDGANRIWFGTRNGIFVQSPNGENLELRYSENNSPLFDNNIRRLAYDGDNGEMFIASDKGLQSIRTKTTTGERKHRKSNVLAYPNPVGPDYQGPIAIKGLARDSDVKITTLSGHLVFETKALGGQAVWEGTDLSGRRVSTGVYLVFSSSASTLGDIDSFVTKILFVD